MAKKNGELKDKIGAYLSETWDELRQDIEGLPTKERAMAKLKLLDYSIPKVQATRDVNTGGTTVAEALLARESKV